MRNEGASRRSRYIGRYPAVNIHHARRYAELKGVPFNWMLTINFGMGGVAPEGASRILQKLFAQRFAPWLRRSAVNDNALRPTYVWSLEAPHGTVSAHVLIYLPSKLVGRFRERIGAWIEGLAGESVPPRALDMRPIYNRVGVTRYILKGISPAWETTSQSSRSTKAK